MRTAETQAVFERLFREVGLPAAIQSDNGVPFCSTGLHGLSALNIWWMRLGLRHVRTQPSHPEQNGAHERMHRTLKAETTRPPALTRLGQQRKFEAFRHVYNHERPHEALGQQPPAGCGARRAGSTRACCPSPSIRPTTSSASWDPRGPLAFADTKCFSAAPSTMSTWDWKRPPTASGPSTLQAPAREVLGTRPPALHLIENPKEKCHPCSRSSLLPMFPVAQSPGLLERLVRRPRGHPESARQPVLWSFDNVIGS